MAESTIETTVQVTPTETSSEQLGNGLGSPPTGAWTMRDVIGALEAGGWVWVTSRGSHRQYRHATHPRRISISSHASADPLDARTLAAIVAQGGPELGLDRP